MYHRLFVGIRPPAAIRDALIDLFGPGADRTATGPAPTNGPAGEPAASRTPGNGSAPEAPQNQTANPPEATPDAPPPAAAVPSGPTELSAAKSAALQEVNSALDAVRDAQRDGDFAQYGEALQRLNDAMDEYQSAD